MSTPVSAATLPAYYSFKSSASRAGWCDINGSSILWPFGHGLSYTTFAYSALSIANADAAGASDAIGPAGAVAVSCVVTNTGARDGDEIVQLYVRDVVASVTTPALALKGFSRVHIRAGEAVTVRLVIDVAEQLKVLVTVLRARVLGSGLGLGLANPNLTLTLAPTLPLPLILTLT